MSTTGLRGIYSSAGLIVRLFYIDPDGDKVIYPDGDE
jgi:hypothetical protein